jgi:hypothetical protein
MADLATQRDNQKIIVGRNTNAPSYAQTATIASFNLHSAPSMAHFWTAGARLQTGHPMSMIGFPQRCL